MSDTQTHDAPAANTADHPAGLHYTLYAAYSADRGERRIAQPDREEAAAEAQAALEGVEGAYVRGFYSLAGFRAEADLLLWLVADTPDALQDAVIALQHTQLGRSLTPWWTNIGVHRDAEFNKGHTPSYYDGKGPLKYVCVYPFVRSYEWYLLDPADRSQQLREHGMMGRDFTDVQPNTVSGFALGDYEWLLSFESEEMTRIVDLMRHLRGAEARRHTREEIPFITGIRKPLAEVVADLP